MAASKKNIAPLSDRIFEFNGVSVAFDMTNPDFFQRYVDNQSKIQDIDLPSNGGAKNNTVLTNAYRSFIDALFGDGVGMEMLPEESGILAFDFLESMLAFGNKQLERFIETKKRVEAISKQSKENVKRMEALVDEADE